MIDEEGVAHDHSLGDRNISSNITWETSKLPSLWAGFLCSLSIHVWFTSALAIADVTR